MGESLIFMKKISLILFIIYSLQVTAQSAVENNLAVNNDSKINVFEMKRKLAEQNRIVQELSKEAQVIDVNLGLNNKKYMKLAEDRAKLEEALNVARKNADLDNTTLKKNYAETKSILMGLLLNKLENTENSADLLSRKILIQNLERRLADLDGMLKSNKEVMGSVDELYQRLQESMETEKELLSLMSELELRKKELRTSLEVEAQKKAETQSKFDEMKNLLAINNQAQKKMREKERLAPMQITEEIKVPSQPLGGEFSPPIYSYQSIDYQKKGVTFNFQGRSEVRATKAGKIVYTGALANYGNVVMIAHGNDTHSVLLGQFEYNVKNGDVVKDAQVVGYTNPKSTNALADGRLYFEVRKNNLVQNTYLLLDKKSLAKNASN